VCGRHLAGVAGLLTAPYAAEHAGEIVGLYTINRFKGEGLGDRLVARMVQEAQTLGLDFVFACTVDERAQQFFERQGFVRVGADDVPGSKWVGYDTRRRQHVAVFRVALPASASATDRAS
jgi:N-acetylglutamate synthase-like GNAT family acetyltransferase